MELIGGTASFGRFGGWRRRYPGGSECRSIFLTVSRAMPNRLAASRWLRPSTWQASRTRRYRSTVYILPPSISKKIEGYRWQSFTPPAAGKSRRFRGLICHRRSQITSRPPMSTSGAAKPSCWKGKGSNERPSSTGACNIATPLPKFINQVSQSLRYPGPHPVSNHLTTDMGRVGRRGEAISPRES